MTWPFRPCPNCGHDPDPQVEAIRLLVELNRKVDHMSEQQAEIDADVQAEEADIVRINAAVALVLTEIQNLQAANPQVDLTGLNQAVADLSSATTAVEGLETPPPAPPAPAS